MNVNYNSNSKTSNIGTITVNGTLVEGNVETINAGRYDSMLKTNTEFIEALDKSDIKKDIAIFVSHSSRDREIAHRLVDFFGNIGIPNNKILCSSCYKTQLPTGVDISDYIHNCLSKDNPLCFIMLSNNFATSSKCNNELGAIWGLGLDRLIFALPGFNIENFKTIMKLNNEIAIVLGDLDEPNNFYSVKSRFYDIKKKLNTYGGVNIDEFEWEKQRDIFLEFIKNFPKEKD